MTMGLACDRDGYDLRAKQCSQCGSRGCSERDHCEPVARTEDAWGYPVKASYFDEHYSSGLLVPNRLYGTTINSEGDAV